MARPLQSAAPEQAGRGAAKRILNDAQTKIAFPPVERKANSHVMVKGAASPFDGKMVYRTKRKSKMYDGPTAKAMTRQKMRCTHRNMSFSPEDIVELHHVDGNHNNWKPRNVVALHRECHQHQEVHKDRIKTGKRDKGRAA